MFVSFAFHDHMEPVGIAVDWPLGLIAVPELIVDGQTAHVTTVDGFAGQL